MNTKTTKFLAVLAVFAMAFAGIAMIAPANDSDAAEATVTIVTVSGNAGTIETESDGNYGYIAAEDSEQTITLPSKGSAALKVFFQNHTAATGNQVSFVLPTGSTYNGTVTLYIASAIDATSGTATYESSGFAKFSFPATNGAAVKVSIAGGAYTFTAVSLKTQDITIPANGSFVIPATTAYEGKVTAAKGTGSISNAAKISVAAESTNVLTISNSAAGVTTMSVDNAKTIASFEMTSGVFGVTTTNLTVTKFVNTFSNNSEFASATKFYYSAYTGTIEEAVYALGDISGMNLTTTAAIDLDGKSVAGKYTYGGKAYQIAGTSADFVLTGPTLTTITGGTLKLVSGQFTTAADQSAIVATVHIGPDAQLALGGAYQMSTGTLVIEGILASSATGTSRAVTATGAATLKVAPTANMTSDITITKNAGFTWMDWTPSTYKISGTLEKSESVPAATLAGNTVIPSGMTLTITDILCLGAYNLTVEGTLVINAGAMVGSQDTNGTAGGKILVSTTGKIENYGTIGKNFPITVQHSAAAASELTTGLITLQGVSGVSLAAKTISGTYYMTTSGTAVKVASIIPAIDVHQITANTVKTSGDLTITNGITMLADDFYVTKGTTLTIGAGAFLNNATDDVVTIENGGKATVLGTFYGSISGQTNDAILVTESSPVYKLTGVQSGDINGTAIAENGSVKGFTIYVDRVEYNTDTAKYYSQRVYIEGTLSAGYSAGNSLIVNMDAGATPLYIAEDATLTTTDKAKFKVDSNVMVQGTLISTDDTFTGTAFGVHYSVTDTTAGQIFYVTDFDSAITLIETVDTKTLTVKGYTGNYMANGDNLIVITEDITIPSGATIDGTTPVIYIDEDAMVTVENLATWNPANFADSGIVGKLYVKNGGACLPTTAKYQVVLVDDENNRLYSSLGIVLSEAEDGDDITLVGDSLDNEIIIIDKKITLNVAKTLQVYNLYIAEGAKVIVTSAGTLNMDCDSDDQITSKLVVDGELNTTSGAFTMNKAGTYYGTITSEGKTTITSAQFSDLTSTNKVKIVGAYYTSSGNYVVTNLSDALKSGNSVTIGASYSTVDEVAVAKDKSLTIAATDVTEKAVKVTVGAIDISKGATVTSNGQLNATIKGVCGTEGETDVVIAVADFTGGFTNTYATDSKGVTTWTFKTSKAASAGSIEVSEGTLTTAHNLAAAAAKDGHYLSVDEGASIYMSVATTLSKYTLVTVDGTIWCSITSPMNLIVAAPMIINGDVYCNAFTATDGAMTALALNGSLTVEATSNVGNTSSVFYLDGAIDNEDVEFNVNGAAVVGSGALSGDVVVTGDLTIAAASYVVSYTDTSDLYTSTSLNETVMYINDLPYAYVYTTTGSVSVTKVIYTDRYIDFDIEDYDVSGIRTASNWKDYKGIAIDGSSNISTYTEMNYTASLIKIDLTVSWANGLSLYIDGVKMTGNTYELDVGAHTVSAQVNPGYACDNMKITFDGAPVTVAGLLLTVEDDGSILAVSGDVYIPEPEPVTPEEKSEWTVTTILLVILVILIAIMAVIVALRLNRS